MGDLFEIISIGFDFGEIGNYLDILTGQITLNTTLTAFFEGLKTFFDNFIAPLFA